MVDTLFPIQKRIKVSFELDVNWKDTLAEAHKTEFLERRQNLIKSPVLLNKLFGLMALQYLQNQLFQLENEAWSPKFCDEDLFYAANYASMDNAEILDNLTFLAMGYEDDAVSRIISMDAFDIKMQGIGIFDQQSHTQLDMEPIWAPMVLERGNKYCIGRGRDEIMAAIQANLPDNDVEPIKKRCAEIIQQATNLGDKLGLRFSRLSIFISTLLKNTKKAEDELTHFLDQYYPEVIPSIYFQQVDGFINLKGAFI